MSTVDVPHTPDDAGSAEPKRRKPRDRPLLIVITGEHKEFHNSRVPNVARRLVAMAASAREVPA